MQNPGDILAIRHGGLSSYRRPARGVPTGLISRGTGAPSSAWSVALDLIAPVLVIAWQSAGCSGHSSCTRAEGT